MTILLPASKNKKNAGWGEEMSIGRQISAARGLLRWSGAALAEKAGLTRDTILKIESDAFVNGRDDLRRRHRPFSGERADFVAASDDAPTLDAAAREIDRPALRPMIASARGINFRRPSKLAGRDHHRV